LTKTNMTVGSVLYAAPEQLTGQPLDGRADQYALAATAYHLLTGHPPFSHTNPAVVIGRHLNTPAPKLADRSSDLAPLDPVMAAALSKDPTGRFNSCQDFALALSQRLDAEPTALRDTRAAIPLPAPASSLSKPASPPTATGSRPRRQRRLVLWGVPAAVIVLIAAAVVVVLRLDRAATGAAVVLEFIDGRWQNTPVLRTSVPCSPGSGTVAQTVSWTMKPQQNATLDGVQTDTILNGNCGPQNAVQGNVYRTTFVATRSGELPSAAVLADPALFMP